MDAKFLSDIIKEMLVCRGKACLPNFGSFTTEQEPAFFSDKGFTINPPYLKPVFSASATNDLGLAEFYAKANNITVDQSVAVLETEIDALRAELQASRIVMLPGLGHLRLTHDSNVFFVADEQLLIFPNYDLLEPVSLRHLPLQPTVPVREPEPATVANREPEPEAIAAASEEPEPEIVTNQEPGTEPITVTNQEPEPEIVASQEPGTEPIAVTEPEQSAEEVAQPVAPTANLEPGQTVVLPVDTPQPKRHLPAWAKLLITAAVLAVLFFAGLYFGGRYCPELVDKLLYSAEEVEILNAVL